MKGDENGNMKKESKQKRGEILTRTPALTEGARPEGFGTAGVVDGSGLAAGDNGAGFPAGF